MKILVISTGGTISSVSDGNIHLDRPFKVLDTVDKKRFGNVEFDCISPFAVLSENMSFELWKRLEKCIRDIDFEKYVGVIILHGSDTLAFTAALLANLFPDKNIVLTASNKPIEDDGSNATDNFNNAIECVLTGSKGRSGVCVSYDGIFDAQELSSADAFDKFNATGTKKNVPENGRLNAKNILVIKPYVGINYNNYNLDGVSAVLYEMYHSATVPSSAKEFMKKCESRGIKFYFVTAKKAAVYETAADIRDKILFETTLENAYARLLIK